MRPPKISRLHKGGEIQKPDMTIQVIPHLLVVIDDVIRRGNRIGSSGKILLVRDRGGAWIVAGQNIRYRQIFRLGDPEHIHRLDPILGKKIRMHMNVPGIPAGCRQIGHAPQL